MAFFFEEINHAGDGGLYAELVQNRSFEEHTLPHGMTWTDGTHKQVKQSAVSYFGLDYVTKIFDFDEAQKKMLGWSVRKKGVNESHDVVMAVAIAAT